MEGTAMRPKMLFLINPNAGKGEIRSSLMQVLDTFTGAGFDVTVHPSRAPQEITKFVIEHGMEYDRIVCCGGDGTLNEMLSGVMALEAPPSVGFLPEGTVNDFAASLHIPRDLEAAAKIAAEGREFSCDVGKFNDHYYTYVAAFGAFTAVAYATPQSQKQALGRAAYILEGIRSLSEIRPYKVRFQHDGETFEDDVILGMMLNATSVGGFKLKDNAEVHLDDGLSEFMLVRQVHNLLEFNEMLGAVLRQDFSSEHFYFFKTDRIELEFDEDVPWTLDGEYGGTVRHAVIENKHHAIRFMTPDPESEK
jgi:YegS/Rv2252/BmrU family lipid kinase